MFANSRTINKQSAIFVDITSDAKSKIELSLGDQVDVFLDRYALAPEVFAILENAAANDQVEKDLRRCATLIGKTPDDSNYKSMKAAAEWGFEAESTNNQTVTFINTCIALEAILGEGIDDVPLSKTLADRFSYLVGRTPVERARLRKMFSEMYKARSKLVHGRQTVIGGNERDHFYFAKTALHLILQKDMRLLAL